MRLFLLASVLVYTSCQCGPDSVADGGTSDAGRYDGGGQPGSGGGQPGSGGGQQGSGGGQAGSGGGTCVPGLAARYRDFKDTHPDFEKFSGSGATIGLVQSQLDAENLPVYAPSGSTNVTSGKANFDQWYRDVADINQGFDRTIPLTTDGNGRWVFDSNAFFPIDNLGFGNQGRDHNFHFTTEIHASFVYQGHEVFTFRGDDDVWVFVNHQLALDLGGLHSALQGTLDFDALASKLNITVGTKYALDIFHAERHTVESNFRVETTIDCLVPEIG